MLVGAVRAALPRQVAVLAGSGAPSALQAVHLTKVVLDAGADAVLALSPQQSSDARQYYELVAGAAAGAPVLAYHYPAVSAPGLPVAVLGELAVQGLKDSSGDVHRLYEEARGVHGMAVQRFRESRPAGRSAAMCRSHPGNREPAPRVVRPGVRGRRQRPTPARRGCGPGIRSLAPPLEAGGLRPVRHLGDGSHGIAGGPGSCGGDALWTCERWQGWCMNEAGRCAPTLGLEVTAFRSGGRAAQARQYGRLARKPFARR